ncbi:MAG: amidohydrolase, partial [Proteobacteria bacterium]|nr:amidohydrolase [Pseudomonadota bacterium]
MCDIIQIRRELHKIPEVGMDLPKTLKYIVNNLEKLQNIEFDIIENRAIVAKTRHHRNDRFIAFRSDMDALPIEELNDVPYKSTHPGAMHACGHDAHMAILLCFAEYIDSLESPEIGVMFIFQPGEEGNAGAKWLLDHEIFKKTFPDRIFALHMFPYLETGSIATRPGPLFIGTEEFYLKLKGPGGHAGFPEKSVDLIESFVKIFN